jgi:hypothetical protein
MFYNIKILGTVFREIQNLFFFQYRIIIQYCLENLRCALRYNVKKIRDKHWLYLILIMSYLVNSVLSRKRFTATLTETGKLRKEFYIIKTRFFTISCEYRAGNINYISNWVITINVAWKTEGHFEIIEGLQNLRKDDKKERPTETVSRIVDIKIPVKLICHALCNVICQSPLSIQKYTCISNKRLCIGRIKTPLELVSIFLQWENCLGLGQSVPFSTEVNEREEL